MSRLRPCFTFSCGLCGAASIRFILHGTPMKIFGILAPVTGRGGHIYQPPTDEELNCRAPEKGPAMAGERLLQYIQSLLEEAAERAE